MSSYQALYRKWRPMKFDDVVGQGHVSDTLRSSVESGRIAHAYLFCGTRGTGKTSAAKIFSRAVNCESQVNGEPCNECPTCLGILSGRIPDVYEMDAASNRGVDNIREICNEVMYTPVGCTYKVYIIDEVHMLSNDAFNALLKTLEEPPSHVIFILATTEPRKIPATIQSRCQRFDFKRIGADDIAGRLRLIAEHEEMDITPDAAELVAELGDGSMRDAISLLDRCAAYGGSLTTDAVSDIVGIIDSARLFEIADAAAADNSSAALCVADAILNAGREPQNLIESLIDHFRALLICKSVAEPAELLEKTVQAAEKYSAQAEKFSVERILYSIKMLSEQSAEAKSMTNPRIAAETAMIKLANTAYSDDTSALIARIENLETRLAAVLSGGTVVNTAAAAPATDNSVNSDGNYQEPPPWDIEEEDSAAPVKEEKAGEPGPCDWEHWPEALSEIKNESKTLFAFLYNAKATKRGGVVEIEVGSQFAYDRIATPGGKEYLAKLFTRVGGETLAVKIYIEGEREAESDEAVDGLSIKDLAAKKDILGGKMDIV